ncbi:MAG TPA: Fic family protein [Candidatus Nanoarchaeia archaeon]|nr:Fic family protein [Candidatus Nanoarchaeia archaeon]
MVIVTKKIKGGKEYYYLEHSIREKDTVKKKELYLGIEIPKNIEVIKKEFINELYKERWYSKLNEIKSKFSREIRTMPKSLREKELQSFMVKFTYDTQRIEGSKLTLKETANLLERGITPKEKSLRDVKEAEAHKRVFYEMLKYKKDFSLSIILYWHKELFQSTKNDIAGQIRSHGVAISGSKFVPPSPVELNVLLKEFFEWYSKNKDKIHPVELAALVHIKFVTIHPFADGNGRISRLIMNFVLNKNNYPMFDIPYENRNSYYTALERSQIKKDEYIFVQWLFRKYIKDSRKYTKHQK